MNLQSIKIKEDATKYSQDSAATIPRQAIHNIAMFELILQPSNISFNLRQLSLYIVNHTLYVLDLFDHTFLGPSEQVIIVLCYFR